ncbi:MAG: hypothetical protein MHM6MM_005009 [Cercozoa sp. M6MM]
MSEGIQTLDQAVILERLGVANAAEVTKLEFHGQQVRFLGELSAFENVTRVELKRNELQDASAIAALTKCTYLDLSDNQIESLLFVEQLPELEMLNVAGNKITQLPDFSKLPKLKHLLCARNQLTELPRSLMPLKLKTLVVSDNPLAEFFSPAGEGSEEEKKMTNDNDSENDNDSDSDEESEEPFHLPVTLFKLSAARIGLSRLPQQWSHLKLLRALSAAGNRIRYLPNWLAELRQLRNVDFGSNRLLKFKKAANLFELPNLRNLRLNGNPLAEHKDYEETMRTKIKSLQVLDLKRVKDKFPKRMSKKEVATLKKKAHQLRKQQQRKEGKGGEDTDKPRAKKGSDERKTAEERAQLGNNKPMRGRPCFKCGTSGHKAFECPLFAKKQQGKGKQGVKGAKKPRSGDYKKKFDRRKPGNKPFNKNKSGMRDQKDNKDSMNAKNAQQRRNSKKRTQRPQQQKTQQQDSSEPAQKKRRIRRKIKNKAAVSAPSSQD